MVSSFVWTREVAAAGFAHSRSTGPARYRTKRLLGSSDRSPHLRERQGQRQPDVAGAVEADAARRSRFRRTPSSNICLIQDAFLSCSAILCAMGMVAACYWFSSSSRVIRLIPIVCLRMIEDYPQSKRRFLRRQYSAAQPARVSRK